MVVVLLASAYSGHAQLDSNAKSMFGIVIEPDWTIGRLERGEGVSILAGISISNYFENKQWSSGVEFGLNWWDSYKPNSLRTYFLTFFFSHSFLIPENSSWNVELDAGLRLFIGPAKWGGFCIPATAKLTYTITALKFEFGVRAYLLPTDMTILSIHPVFKASYAFR
ncbi:MAG: hypothetical protein HQ472_10910 [Ignavibacteria bacterium]|nr:hypothetical protein [Ignavibacteria bacterium]